MAVPRSSFFRRWRWLFLIAGIALVAAVGQFRRQEVVGWSRYDTLTQDGEAALDAGDLARAESLFSDALAEAERTGTSRTLAVAAHNLAGLRLSQRRPTDAEPLLRRAIELVERERPADESYLARLNNELAAACLAQQRPEEALVIMDRSIDLSRRALGPGEPATVRRMRERAGILLVLGRVPDAVRAANRATTATTLPATRRSDALR